MSLKTADSNPNLRLALNRNAAESTTYFLRLLRPDMHILDVGCGPGTITVDLAVYVLQGQVIGLDPGHEVLEKARTIASERGVTNVSFVVGDIHALDYPDGSFDVVHAHQILHHVKDPVQALKEMRRVTKPGGIVVAREMDFSAVTWYSEVDGMYDWQQTYMKVARANGGVPNAGRQIHAWAHEAGFDRACIACSASANCYTAVEERAWWTELWTEQTLNSKFVSIAISKGLATKEDLDHIAQAWRT